MDWLNYHHLRYFAAVVREGSIARASRVLHVSQPSISTQLRLLEQALGEKLLTKRGRTLAPTDLGRLVYGYAEQIFGLGREMLDAVADRPTGRPLRAQIGVADSVPRALAMRLLVPLLQGDAPLRLAVRHDRAERLLTELGAHELDLVLADASVRSLGSVRAFRHELGQSPIGVFAPAAQAARLRRRFPESLRDAPFVVPLADAELRREFDRWCHDRDLAVRIEVECEDWALAKSFAAAAELLLLAPSVMASDLRRLQGLRLVGELDGAVLRYYVISVERRVRHPVVSRVLAAAEHDVFG